MQPVQPPAFGARVSAAGRQQIGIDAHRAHLDLARDVTTHPLLPAAGKIEVRPAHVDADLLKACRADVRTERWWLDRLHRVAAVAGVGLP